MLSMKYKVRRNDTSAIRDLASIIRPREGGVGYAVRQVSAPKTVFLFRRETYLRNGGDK
jgi:hypothetical protein